MTTRINDRLRAHPPSLYDEQAGMTLFVWRELGQWIVLDDEATILLRHFDQERSVEEVLREHCRAHNKQFESAVREALPFLNALSNTGHPWLTASQSIASGRSVAGFQSHIQHHQSL